MSELFTKVRFWGPERRVAKVEPSPAQPAADTPPKPAVEVQLKKRNMRGQPGSPEFEASYNEAVAARDAALTPPPSREPTIEPPRAETPPPPEPTLPPRDSARPMTEEERSLNAWFDAVFPTATEYQRILYLTDVRKARRKKNISVKVAQEIIDEARAKQQNSRACVHAVALARKFPIRPEYPVDYLGRRRGVAWGIDVDANRIRLNFGDQRRTYDTPGEVAHSINEFDEHGWSSVRPLDYQLDSRQLDIGQVIERGINQKPKVEREKTGSTRHRHHRHRRSTSRRNRGLKAILPPPVKRNAP